MAGLLPLGRLVEIPAVAHTLVYTAPQQLAEVTRQFLAARLQPGGIVTLVECARQLADHSGRTASRFRWAAAAA